MNDLTIELDSHSSKHLYEQIYHHIRKEIQSGKLLAGEKLPSTRFLAGYLQVSRSTVEMAYDQLMAEGYIEALPYRGFFVCRVETLYREIGQEDGAGHVEVKKNADIRYDFSPNTVDLSCFPMGIWRRNVKTVLSDETGSLLSLGDPQGDYRIRNAIWHYLHASRGVNCTPDQIIIGAGNDYLLMLLEKILEPGQRVALENPTYKRAYQIFSSMGYPISSISMDENGINIKELRESDANLAYVMPSHQYPTGIVMPIGRRGELLQWAGEKEERFLIEDDYDSEFRYRGKPIPSLQASDTQGKVIYIGTFSKSIAPAIRISYMVLPERLMERYHAYAGFYSCTVSRVDQAALSLFMESGSFERHLNRMRKIYKGRHDVMLQECKRLLTPDRIYGENSGLHLLLQFDRKRNEKKMLQNAAKQKIKAYALSDNYIGRLPMDWQPTLILGYAGLDEASIKEGILQLSKCIFADENSGKTD